MIAPSLHPIRHRALLLGVACALVACRADDASDTVTSTADPVSYNADWREASHGKVSPNYSTVFPQASVNVIEIEMTAAQWAAIRTDMTTLWGFDFGSSRAGGGGGFPETEPAYQDVTLRFNGSTWKNVGFRLKGNSSLSMIWSSGNYKLPFRLHFDKFEDKVPAIKNQRFYGFQELSFSPNWSDNSVIREKSVVDILRMAGIPAAQAAFYRVYINFGAGLRYVGVYTALEVIDDTMVASQFSGDTTGNIYKPESNLTSFVQSDFEKKNNEKAADYSDVQAFVSALNSSLRTTNPAQWRTNLEATFNVDHFLKWLAINTAIVNWDTYGAMAHNYYLFNAPGKGLTWIPWDHNMSMDGSPGITGSATTTTNPNPGGGPAPGSRSGLSLSLNEVSASWPLIRYLADDPVYFARYKSYMKSFMTSVFTIDAMSTMFDRYHSLVSPYVIGADGEQSGATHTSAAAFTAALPALKAHVQARQTLVNSWLP